MYIYMSVVRRQLKLISVDDGPLMKSAGMVENSGHCIYCIELK